MGGEQRPFFDEFDCFFEFAMGDEDVEFVGEVGEEFYVGLGEVVFLWGWGFGVGLEGGGEEEGVQGC